MSKTNFLILSPNPSPTIQSPTISPVPPQTDVNQGTPPPPITSEAIPGPNFANVATPLHPIVNQVTPPFPVANVATPPPPVANEATPPPTVVNDATPPPPGATLLTPTSPPPDTTLLMPPSPPPDVTLLTPPSSDANQLTPPPASVVQPPPPLPVANQLSPPPSNGSEFESEFLENKNKPNPPPLSNLISNSTIAPPHVPTSPDTVPAPTLGPPPPPPPTNPVSIPVQLSPPGTLQQPPPPFISPPSITPFVPSPPPVDPSLALSPPAIPVPGQAPVLQVPPPPLSLPPPGFSNPIISPVVNPTEASPVPHVHVEPVSTQGSSAGISKHDQARFTEATIGITLFAATLFFCLMYFLVIFVKNLRRNQTEKFSSLYKGKKINAGLVSSTPSNNGGFSYKQLHDMTDGFSDANLIGEGGFAHVYKGTFPNGNDVAVKQIKKDKATEQELRLEMEIIGRIHHRHLVKFLGYCLTETYQLLVYEFVPNRTLCYHLHEEGLPVLGWQKRVKIAIGSARGLKYLHEDCEPKIVHRDIKPANILLDNSFEPKLADFGLAKVRHDGNTHVSTRVMGTYGYLAPEYAITGKLTYKSDVFSFGVVLLELITGREAINPSDPEESLVDWARPLLVEAINNGKFETLVDPKLEGNYVEKELCRMVNVAAGCVRHSAANRPSMPQVLKALESGGNLSDLSNGVKFGESTKFNSRQYSLEIESFQKREFGDAGVTIMDS